jgi:hypothetical protein
VEDLSADLADLGVSGERVSDADEVWGVIAAAILLAAAAAPESVPMQVAPAGPVDMEQVPGVNWTCRLETEKTSFALKAQAPDFAGRREPFGRLPIALETDGPGWTKGQHDIVSLASAPNFRRYLVSWEAKDGGSYSLDMILLRGEYGISHLTYRPSPAGPVASLFAKLIARGVCESEFTDPAEGIANK